MSKISADDFFNTETAPDTKNKPKTLTKMSADDFFSTSTKDYEAIEEQRIRDGSKETLNNTLKSVTKPTVAPVKTPTPKAEPVPFDFKATQAADLAKKKQDPFAGKTLAPINTVQNNIQDTLKGKLPAAELLQQTGRGPANASQIPTTEYEKRKRDIANSKIDVPFSDKEINTPAPLKGYANVMNYLAFGNPLGRAVSNSFAGNSGVTQRDTTGNKTVDKVTDLVNNLVTPFITPTGAPTGAGPNLAPYTVAKQALNTKPGMQYTNYLANSLLNRGLVPKGSAATANRIAQNTIAETMAGPLQNVAAGLMNGQDSNQDILNNAQMGVTAGLGLGFGGSFLSELLTKSGIPEAEILELMEANPRTIRKAQAGSVNDLGTSTDPVANPYTFGLDEATPSTMGRSANAAEGRTALSEIDQSIRDLETKYGIAVIDEYKALKEQVNNPKGKTKGSMNFDDSGNLVSKNGWVSNNPPWYQQAMKENKYNKLSNKKLWEIAQKHVDEGFDTEVGRAPSWKQENAYDEQMAAFTSARETMQQSVREIDPVLNVTDSPLKEQVLRDTRKAKTEIKPKTEIPPKTEVSKPKAKESILQPKPKAKGNPEIEKLDQEMKDYRDLREQQVKSGTLDQQEASRQIKGRAMQVAAEKRAILQGDSLIPVEGGLTTKELQTKIDRLNSNYKGKPVLVDGKEGKIKSNAYGKVVVEFPDGTTKAFDPEDVVPKTNVKDLIAKQTEAKAVEESVATTIETPVKNVPAEIKPKVELKPIAAKKKPAGERGFYHTLKNSGRADEAVSRMEPKYQPITNETSLAGANERVKNLEKSKNDVLGRPLKTAEDGATALRLVQEYTKMGDHETAALISGKAAEDFTQAGQLIQSADMWNRLSPEGMLLRVQREIGKINDVLGPAEEKLSLSADDAAKITNTGEKMQGVQKVRDLSQEVLDMVTNKKTGDTLTADEQKLLVEFEKQVKTVNKSVKPFLKTAKSDAEKIAKIKPENRTRDQVVQYLDQKASEALARRQKARNLGIVADLNNPVIDYSIIAAAKIARGVRTYADLTEDMVKTVGSGYKQYADEVFTKATQRFRKENGLPTTSELERVIRSASKEFDEESKQALRRMAAEIGYFTDENLKRELTQNLQQVMKTYGRSTLGDKITGIQTANQLLSIPTFLRNTLGNAGQFGLEKLNKVAAVPIDWTISKFTGERTIQFIPMNQEKAWKNLVSGTGSGWREVSAMGTLDNYNVKPSVFKDNNPLKYLTKLTGASLQGMDLVAYKAAYGDVMATYAEQLGRAQGMTRKEIKANMPELLSRLDDTVRELADQAGKYATYQDETMLSRAAQSTKKALNAPTDKIFRAAVEKGLITRAWSLEGFGLGDIVLKYAKTPANLVMRGIDYSPLGFLRAIGEFMPLLKNGGKHFNQFNATRALSRAITGTVGLTGMGYALADAGLLTGASSSDPDKRSIEEQSGEGAYKANLTGIYRWIMSGLDKKEAAYQKGDFFIDYAWLQPAAITLGMGVNFREALNEKKPGEKLSNVELAKRSLIGGLRTVLENPMVTGLSDVVGGVSDLITRQDTKKLTGIVKGIPSSFVPALLGQARNVTDNKQRVTYDQSAWKEMINLVKNRVPGLSKKLPIAHDSLGNERQRIQGGKEYALGQYLNSFVNPTKFTTYKVSPEAKTVLDILNDSNNSSVLPRMIQKTVAFTNEEGKQDSYRMNGKEYTELQKKTGKRVMEELQYEQDYLSDNSVNIEDRVKVLRKILEDIGRETRDEFKEEKGLVND